MQNINSILDTLVRHAEERPNDLAFAALRNGIQTSETITFKQLHQAVISTAGHLQSKVARGERVLLLYDHSFDFLIPFLACLASGLIAVPAPLPNAFTAKRVYARMQGIMQDSSPVLALSTSNTLVELKAAYQDHPEFAAMQWLATDQAMDGSAYTPIPVQKDNVAYLQYTSGSTSTPKGVMITHGNIMHQVSFQERTWIKPGDKASSFVSWMPYYHDMGLFSGIFFPLQMGIPGYLMSPVTFIRHPEYWLEAVSHYQASHTVGPVFSYEMCYQRFTPERRSRLKLDCVKFAGFGAEPIQPGIVEEFVRTFAPQGFSIDAVIPGYGLAESTLAATVTPLTGGPPITLFDKAALARRVVSPSTSPDAVRLVGSGRAFDEIPVLIVNETTMQRCGPDQVGEVWLGGPSIALGYWEKEEDNKKIFQAHLADSNEGPFLRSGDLGFFHQGTIYIAGRLKDIMIFQGQNFYPQDIEWVVQESHPDLQKGACAVFSVEVDQHEQLVVFQEIAVRRGDRVHLERIASSIRRAIATQHGLTTHAVVLLRKGTIPKTSSGKIQRHAARTDFLSGKVDSAVYISYTETAQSDASAPQTELQAALVEIFQDVLEVSSVGIDDNFFERGGDSLSFVQLVDLVEERLGLVIPLDRPMEDLCVRNMARVLGGEEQPEEVPSQRAERKWRAIFTTFVRKASVSILAAFPYKFVDSVVRWLSRQALVRRVFYRQDSQNLKLVLEDLHEPRAISAIFPGWVYSNLLYFWRIAALNRRNEFVKRVHVEGLEHLQHARATGRGLILLGSNVGLKHLTVVFMTFSNYEDMMLVGGGMRTLGLVGLSQFKSQFLLEIDQELIKSNSHLSYQLARGKNVLEHGGVLMLAGDGHRGLIKQDLPFLARMRPFGTGFANLALTTDAVVLPVFTRLLQDGTAEIQFHPPLTVPESGRDAQIRALVEQYAHRLEQYWRSNIQNVRTRQIKQYLALPYLERKN